MTAQTHGSAMAAQLYSHGVQEALAQQSRAVLAEERVNEVTRQKQALGAEGA